MEDLSGLEAVARSRRSPRSIGDIPVPRFAAKPRAHTGRAPVRIWSSTYTSSCSYRRGAVSVAAAAALAVAGCDVDTQGVTQAATAQPGFQRALDNACSIAGRQAVSLPGSCTILSASRSELASGDHLVEYRATVQVGPDAEHDVIGLHRVIKETAPWTPIVTRDALMLVHGDAWPFDGAFLDAPAGGAVASFLAQNNVDVWGIDLRWTQVPAGTSDVTFLRSWGLDTDARDLGVALSIARASRYYTGSGFDKMLLLGWSRGGQLGYTYLGGETTQPAASRHVRGYIPVDLYLKVPANDPRQADACARIHDPGQGNLAAYNAGVYASNGGALLAATGALAASQPDSPNPFFPPGHPFFGYTNKQVGLGAGEATYQLLFLPPMPHYHFTGGRFDAGDVPAGLSYVASEQRWFSALQRAAPFEPLKVLLDADAITCNDGSSSLDAHLAQISVPVLYLGAGGGFGASGLYTVSLLHSPDKTSLLRSETPGDDLHDLGHFDIWLGQDAQRLWWQPLLRWVQDHRPAR